MADASQEEQPVHLAPVPDGSILGDLRALRERKATEAAPTFVLDIPGYGEPSALAVVYRYPSGGYQQAVKAASVEGTDKPDAQLEGNADLIIVCCSSVVGKRPDGSLVDLLTDAPITAADTLNDGFNALRFNPTLAEKLKIAVAEEVRKPGRFIVRQVFSPAGQATGRYDGDLALIATGNQLYRWLSGFDRQLDEELAGE